MTDSTPALRLRRLIVAAVLLVPLVVDPFGRDTQGYKTLALALLGSLALGLEGLAGCRRPGRWRPLDLPEAMLALLLAWAALSLSWATNPGVGALRVVSLVGLLGALRGVRDAVESAGDARRWLGGLIAVGVVAVVLDGAAVLEHERTLAADTAKHASWLFVHNNLAAACITPVAPLALVLLLAGGTAARRLAGLAALAAIAGYLVLLRSRAGLLAATVGLLVVLALLALRGRLGAGRAGGRRWAIVAGVVVVLGALLPFSDQARGLAKDAFYRGVALSGVDLGDTLFRPRLWRQTMSLVREAPLTGVGAGNFVVEYPRVERYPEIKPHAHNDALQVLSELGLPGLILFFGLGAATVLAGLRALAARAAAGARREYAAAAGLLAALAVFAIVGLFEVPFALGGSAASLGVLVGGLTGLAAVRSPAASAATVSKGARLSTPTAARPSGTRRAAAALALLVALVSIGLTAVRLPASWLVTRAQQAGQELDLDRSERLLRRLAGLRTGSVQPYLLLASLATLRGDGEAALAEVREARRLWPHNAELAEAEGDKLAALGRFDDAVDCFQESLDLSPARDSALLKLVTALDQSGQLQAAIDLLEYQVRSNTALTLDSVRKLADMWRRRAEQLAGDERTRALVAARHFYAVLLDEGPPAWWPQVDATFKDVTHRLQILPGAPTSWFEVYRRYMEQGGWNMPASALYTSIGRDGFRLFPGWVEPYGPPMPGAWRRP